MLVSTEHSSNCFRCGLLVIQGGLIFVDQRTTKTTKNCAPQNSTCTVVCCPCCSLLEEGYFLCSVLLVEASQLLELVNCWNL